MRRAATLLALALLAGAAVVGPASPAAAGGTVITVTTTADEDNGPTGGTSLREAVAQAASDGAATTVQLAAGATYDLADCTGGDLDHAAAQELVVAGEGSTVTQACVGERMFEATGGGDLEIQELTLSGGKGGDGGGSLRVSGGGALRLTGSTVTGSLGRAVLAFGPIAVTSSTFTNNNGGSALEGLGLTIDVVDSTFTNNGEATGGDGGGAIYPSSTNTVLTVSGSTFSGNMAGSGGAIYNFFNDTTVTNSTFVGNEAVDEFGSGGAIAAPQGNLTLRHVTFSGNAVPANGDGADVSVAETLTVRSTAFTGGGSGEPCEVIGAVVSEGYSYEQGSTSCGLDDPDDLPSEESAFLEPLADNGGTTLTLLPGFSSPLVDTAPAAECLDPLDIDQAGTTRPVDGDFDGVAECDTGAVERTRLQLFTDVPPGHQFFNDISWMAWNLISTGFQPGPTYRPSQEVTRRAMSAFLYRLADPSGFTPPPTPTFGDVPTTNPLYTEIEWMADEGITTGFPGNLYKPGLAVSRQAMSAFMYRMAGSPAFPDPPTATFSDVPTSSQFFTEIEWMSAEGITNGFPGGVFRPGQAVSRQAMSAFLFRLDPLIP